jgi:transposase-like protein
LVKVIALAQNEVMKKQSKQEQQERMFSIIKSCKESGMSNKDFCQQNGIGQAMFYYWQKKLSETQLNKPESFIPVSFNSDKKQAEMEIIYPNGVRLKLASSTDLSVIRMLIGLA